MGGMPLVPTTKMADTHKYSVSGNHWLGEPCDLLKTTSAFEFRPAFFGADSKTRIFYKYVVFKHSISSFPNFYRSANTPSPVWRLLFTNRRQRPQNGKASQTFIYSKYFDDETFSSLGNTDCFKPQEEMNI